MNSTEALINALRGIQDTLEEQTKLLRDLTYYPTNDREPPRLLTGIAGAVEVLRDDEQETRT